MFEVLQGTLEDWTKWLLLTSQWPQRGDVEIALAIQGTLRKYRFLHRSAHPPLPMPAFVGIANGDTILMGIMLTIQLSSQLSSYITHSKGQTRQWAAIFMGVFQTTNMSSFSSYHTCQSSPWAAILVGILQTIQVSSSSRRTTGQVIPWASILMGIFQTIQVSSFSSQAQVKSAHGQPFSWAYFR
jgi:hypothetical protein